VGRLRPWRSQDRCSDYGTGNLDFVLKIAVLKSHVLISTLYK
jgi:hypothetical protein